MYFINEKHTSDLKPTKKQNTTVSYMGLKCEGKGQFQEY